MKQLIVNHGSDWFIHLSALLSAVGEANVDLAVKINIEGFHNVLNLGAPRLNFFQLFISRLYNS